MVLKFTQIDEALKPVPVSRLIFFILKIMLIDSTLPVLAMISLLIAQEGDHTLIMYHGVCLG